MTEVEIHLPCCSRKVKDEPGRAKTVLCYWCGALLYYHAKGRLSVLVDDELRSDLIEPEIMPMIYFMQHLIRWRNRWTLDATPG